MNNLRNSPNVAILLSAYNGTKWINEQVASILNQEKILVHLYISVDLSTDATYEICKQFEGTNHNVTVLKYGQRFGGAAKNFFRLICDVDFSSFDYIAFADQDDVWFPDKLSHGIAQMRKNNADAYSGNVIAFWEDGREKLIDKAQPQRELDYLFEAAGPGCTYIFSNKAASLIKNYLTQVPELNNFILHDWLSYAILRHNQYKWFIDPVPKMKYRQHNNNQVGANTSFKGKFHRMQSVLSGQAFACVAILINILNINDIDVSSRIGVLKLAAKVNHLRRRKIDQVFAFIALIIYAIKGDATL